MTTATDELIKTHRVVEKLLKEFAVDQPRFSEVMKTLHRTVSAHAWLQDEILIPALKEKPLIGKSLIQELVQEHKDIDGLLKTLLQTPRDQKIEVDAYVLQIRTLLETHFKKETSALYPLAEKVLEESALNQLRGEMARREIEVREVIR